MSTVFTPEALRNSFKSATLGEVKDLDADEIFYFEYPSPNVVDEMNGDGVLYEIHDFAIDFSFIDIGRRNIPATSETEVWIRKKG